MALLQRVLGPGFSPQPHKVIHSFIHKMTSHASVSLGGFEFEEWHISLADLLGDWTNKSISCNDMNEVKKCFKLELSPISY